ncbi:hypothetical protein RB195_019287 [Necator americanus]|uniref:Uncharacterized protein n=1 Tax=Necator americanus TaxID=51031 RepID=A0ABR1CFH1_NECAM
MTVLIDEEWKTKFRQRVSVHMECGSGKSCSMQTFFTKCIKNTKKETHPVLTPLMRFAFASAAIRFKYNSAYITRNTGDPDQEKRLRGKFCRQLQQDSESEWTLGAKSFEKSFEDKNSQRAYASLRQYSQKVRRCSPVLNNEVAVGERNTTNLEGSLQDVNEPASAVNY